jgi:hypothetical protein
MGLKTVRRRVHRPHVGASQAGVGRDRQRFLTRRWCCRATKRPRRWCVPLTLVCPLTLVRPSDAGVSLWNRERADRQRRLEFERRVIPAQSQRNATLLLRGLLTENAHLHARCAPHAVRSGCTLSTERDRSTDPPSPRPVGACPCCLSQRHHIKRKPWPVGRRPHPLRPGRKWSYPSQNRGRASGERKTRALGGQRPGRSP